MSKHPKNSTDIAEKYNASDARSSLQSPNHCSTKKRRLKYEGVSIEMDVPATNKYFASLKKWPEGVF